MRLSDGRLMPAKDAPIGGQAVLEGVMMRGVSTWAVAVRVPAGHRGPERRRRTDTTSTDLAEEAEIAAEAAATTVAGVGPGGGQRRRTASRRRRRSGRSRSTRESFESAMKRRRIFRLPVIRGVIALYESLKIGMKALGISANAQLDGARTRRSPARPGASRSSCRSLFAVGLFFVLPVTVASFWKDELGSSVLFVIVEKLIRITIFLGYLWAISHIHDLRRVFEYHGAEHKVISCYEAGEPLTPENAQKLLAPPRALRDQLPADRDDHRGVRVRADRAAGAALADPVAHRRASRSWPGSPTR